jgi:flagellar L-ring protein FlgH
MPTNSSNLPTGSISFAVPLRVMCAVAVMTYGFGAASPVFAKKKVEAFLPTLPPPAIPLAGNGAIFSAGAGYAPLTSGARASQVGDILTIVLVERTSASKSSSATSDHSGSIGLTPPATGPLSFFKPSDINASGTQSFKGKGETAQSNTLSGEVSVTITAIYPNGSMQVRGEKQLTLNRGDEHIQISGIVRGADIDKGETARASRQGWLQRFFSRVSPF